MAISHRLYSPMDVRPDEGIEEPPKRIVFLSVEGTHTEKDYFRFVERYKSKLRIKSVVHVETLSRYSRDTCSDPEMVYSLLLDFLKIREEGILSKDIYSILSTDKENFSIEYIDKYLKDELSQKDSQKLKSAIQLAGIDIDYQKFLHDYKGEDGNDVFAVIIDRDQGCHSESSLRELIGKCKENGCYCFLSNPCFEFWLLLHLSDVKKEYCEQFDKLLANEKITLKHTFVSNEVSKKANHQKKISEKRFVEFYLDNIDNAIKRADDFCQDEESLLSCLGSNIPILFEILREDIRTTKSTGTAETMT